MIRVTVQHGDGLGDREWLRSVVARAQAGLKQAGQTLQADGLFGDDSGAAVRAFQATAGLAATGIVDKPTWDTLEPHLDIALAPLQAPLAAGRWADLTDLIDQMQQERPASGIATRRREEAFIIRSELAYLKG